MFLNTVACRLWIMDYRLTSDDGGLRSLYQFEDFFFWDLVIADGVAFLCNIQMNVKVISFPF